jgi:hypothetical protein
VDVGGIGGNRQFETRAAIDAGRRVRHELFTRSSTDR